jgi:hypothetical protein
MINTKLIQAALNFYQRNDFVLATVPMLVDKKYANFTKPIDKDIELDLKHNGKHYVASAEQSFLELYDKGNLNKNMKYAALTPCYRQEDILDNTHFNIFIKLELIIFVNNYEEAKIYLCDFIGKAKFFFSYYAKIKVKEERINKDQIDLVSAQETELGSYGIRQALNGDYYVYGTGLAEPRTTFVEREEVNINDK